MIKFNSERGNVGCNIIFFPVSLLRTVLKELVRQNVGKKDGVTNRRYRPIRMFFPKGFT